MRIKAFFVLLFIITFASLAQAQKGGKKIELLDGELKLFLPAGFKSVKERRVDFKFAKTKPEEQPTIEDEIFFFTDKNRDSSLAVAFFGASTLGSNANAVIADVIPEMKNLVEAAIEKNAKPTAWRKREIVKIKDVSWIHLSFDVMENSIARTYDMHLTDFQGFLLAVNLNMPKTQYESNQAVVSKFAASLDADPVALGLPVGATIITRP